ncbi:MAG: SRPBCC family protein [Thermoflexus sp.]
MKYRHEVLVRAPLERVSAWHRDPEALARLIPPGMHLHWELREPLGEGSRVRFVLQIGPVRVRWMARHQEVSKHGFTDEQEEGPFRRWIHRHRFEERGPDQTAVVDEIEADWPHDPRRWPVAAMLWMGLPLLFAYRGWKLRRFLEGLE